MIPFNGLTRPLGKYKEIFDYVLAPDPEVKSVDVCCGLGFGKTLIGIQIACITMDSEPGHMGMFLEPDWDRVDNVFIPMWEKYVPEHLYTHKVGKNKIVWNRTGSEMIYRPRVITGSKERRRSKNRGIPTTFVIDDETAIGFDLVQLQNTFNRIRLPAKIRYFLTLSTPIIGPYGDFINRGGNKLFKGRTRDNFYLHYEDPQYETRCRQLMSEQQARQELDAELIALEGRIFKEADLTQAWPKGTINNEHHSFKKGQPWWLMCDLGSATGAYLVVQQMKAEYRGHRLFDGHVWVVVADYCPLTSADAASAFSLLKQHYGTPVGVTSGADINSKANTDGTTVSYISQQAFGNVPIYPCNESVYNKIVQYNNMLYLIKSGNGERRLTVARDYVEHDRDSKRGFKQMLEQYAMPAIDERRAGDLLPKGHNQPLCHVADSALMGFSQVAPPPWAYGRIPA